MLGGFQRGIIAIALCTLVFISYTTWLYYTSISLKFDHIFRDSSTRITSQTPEIIPNDRANDYTDIFSAFQGHTECGFGSMDLHAPLSSLCKTRQELFNAMTDGRRAYFNAPFEPLGCDLHFFTTSEICEILGRFESVIFIGDSLMRQTEWAIAMLLQENYFNGGQSSWLDPPKAQQPCVCEHQAFSWECVTAETSIELLYENQPETIKCPNRPQTKFRYALMWPLNQTYMDETIAEVTSEVAPEKPYAFVFGHAGWNDVNATATIGWTDQVLQTLDSVRPYLESTPNFWTPKAFVSLSAAGPEKPAKWMATQGNGAVPKYQNLIRQPILDRGLDFLSPFNMSLNATIPDGTHVGIRINLLKAMTLINWLNMIDTSTWR